MLLGVALPGCSSKVPLLPQSISACPSPSLLSRFSFIFPAKPDHRLNITTTNNASQMIPPLRVTMEDHDNDFVLVEREVDLL